MNWECHETDDKDLIASLQSTPQITKFKDLQLLKEFANGIKEDQNRSESDEIIEIYVEDGKFKESAIFVHEPQIDLNRYDFGY